MRRPLAGGAAIERGAAPVFSIDHQRRRTFQDHPAHRRHDPRERRRERKPGGKRHRREKRRRDRGQHHLRSPSAVWDIFGIPGRAVATLAMMIQMDAFVKERRDQEGHTNEDVPRQLEVRHVACSTVRDFVDEQDGAIQSGRRSNEESDAHCAGRPKRESERDPSRAGGCEEVAPIDERSSPKALGGDCAG